jgi:hypothetical protein
VGHRNCLDVVEKRNTFPRQQSLLGYPIVGALPSNTQRCSGFWRTGEINNGIVVRCLATGDVFDFINNSHRTDPKENATAA